MMKKDNVETSQIGNPFRPLSSIPQNADSGIVSLPARNNETKNKEPTLLKYKFAESVPFVITDRHHYSWPHHTLAVCL